MRVALLMGLMALGAVQPAAAAAVEGRDYQRLSMAQPTSDPKKVVVTEFFSYQCPHCYSFAPSFEAWSRKVAPDVLVERVPVGFGRKPWEVASRAFLVFSSMKILPRMDTAMFDAIHRQGVRLDSEEMLTRWVAAQGVDTREFSSVYRSFGLDTQYKAAEARVRGHLLPGVPAVVIDGRYLVMISDNGNFPAQLAVVDELIAKARREKGAK